MSCDFRLRIWIWQKNVKKALVISEDICYNQYNSLLYIDVFVYVDQKILRHCIVGRILQQEVRYMEKQRPLIGIIVNEPDRYFLSRSLNIIEKTLFSADMDAAIFTTLLTGGDQANYYAENEIFNLIDFDVIDGLIVFLNGLNGEKIKKEIEEMIHSNCPKPVVFIDSTVDGSESVLFDNDEGARLIAEHLVKVHNVKTVDYISGPADSPFHDAILDCFKKAFEDLGVDIPDERIQYGPDWMGDYRPIANRIIERGLPDAVVCCSDFTASAVIGELTAMGVRVPGDVIVTGYSKDEPYKADYFNITSVTRDPGAMSLDAANRIISRVKGTEFTPVSGMQSCIFEPGVTCGCAQINYPELARSALESMIQTRRPGFDSYYNFMSEDLIGAVDFEDYLWKLNWYTFFLGDIEGFWLCLNDGVMHTDGEFKDFTDRIDLPYMKENKVPSVDFERSFDRSELLPAIFAKRDKPRAYIFNSLHFSDLNFGYTVMCYGENSTVYDITYAKWFRYVTCALEKHRRHIIYNDAVADAQIRDSLTGLLNMRGFKHTMNERCGKFDREDKLLRIISVDIDNLGGINTAYGYSEGDRVLQKLAVILNNSAGEDDICVRVSGDEFLIAGIIDAAVPVDEVPIALDKNISAYNSKTDSEYGIHIYTSRVTSPITSPDILDTLPYEASYQRTLTKDNHNKNRKHIAHPDENDFNPEERRYVAKLLNDNLFTYHFQPIVNARNGEIFAYEALMRSTGDMKLSPIAILNHAGAMGRLGDIERHTMKNLFGYLENHKEQFEDKKLFINSIPAYMLSDKDFDELYAKYKDVMDKVVVEFTEQTEASSDQLKTMLDRSRKMGFKIAIDDYGTGYSNISSLLTFMPNCVKIDRSLIMNIHDDKRKQHFTQNIIDYAHDNNFKVLAEGVELSEELKTVISMGVDLIQGYFTAKPSPEIVPEIEPEVSEEIKDFNKLFERKKVRKTYFTSGEKEASVMSLDFDNYTDILVCSDEFTLRSNKSYTSGITVRIKDDIDCTLNLVDVSMKNENTEACICIGKNSRLTLNIVGDVSIASSINVPESAELKIVGDGRLTMTSSSNQVYGIGSDPGHSYGNIGIYLKNKMHIHIDSDSIIAIGGGYNENASRIDIQTEELVIELSGKTTLGIGCFNSNAIVSMRDTKLYIEQQCAQGIGIGSYEKSIKADIENCSIKMVSSGNLIGGVASYGLKGNSVEFNGCKIDMLFKGTNIYCIGSNTGDIVSTMHNCDLKIICEGANAFAIGSKADGTKVSMYECTGSVAVRSGSGCAIMVSSPHRIIIERSSVDISSRE